MTNLDELIARLGRVQLEVVHQRALEEAAQRIEDAVRSALSRPPGSEHDMPWLHSGDLRNSIVHETNASQAIIASTSTVALYQELGTRCDPPRPFLAPVSAALGESIAQMIGSAVLEAVRAPLSGDPTPSVDDE